MSIGRLDPAHRAVAMRMLLVDRLSAEVAQRFQAAGIDCLLVKGPVIAEWLYAGDIRGYVDSDLLVPRDRWEDAIAVLVDSGFRPGYGDIGHPSLESADARAFFRGSEALDLHVTIPGLDASPEDVWAAIWADAVEQRVGGRMMAVPDRPAILMHLALHAAHHFVEPKPMEDLRRGLEQADEDQWRRAAELAASLAGLPGFASGLRRLPEGADLARSLGVEGVGSVHFDLRTSGVPTAEGLHQLLAPGQTISERARRVVSELFPSPSFMRWSMPLAGRSIGGLVISYPLRWLWLAAKVPAGLRELRKARRRREE